MKDLGKLRYFLDIEVIQSPKGIWLQLVGQLVDVLVVIYCDNINSTLFANNPIYYAMTKHIEVHYHFIRKKIITREINLIHVSIEDQVVDIFTKALSTDKLRKLEKCLVYYKWT
jgi:hypothetical protein